MPKIFKLLSLHDSVIEPKYGINISFLGMNQNVVFAMIYFLGLAFFIFGLFMSYVYFAAMLSLTYSSSRFVRLAKISSGRIEIAILSSQLESLQIEKINIIASPVIRGPAQLEFKYVCVCLCGERGGGGGGGGSNKPLPLRGLCMNCHLFVAWRLRAFSFFFQN